MSKDKPAIDPRIKRVKLSELRPQVRNANKHTERGAAAMEGSISEVGWIGAGTLAADNESFDGSQRLDTLAALGFDDVIIVDSDGTVPIFTRRTDIPSATDPRAVRAGILANRVAELDLSWDASVLKQIHDETPELLTGAFTPKELDFHFESLPDDEAAEGEGGDEFDATPNLEGPTRAKAGDIWQIGPHRLMCGDSLNQDDVGLLLGEHRASLLLTDPPYNIGKNYGAGTNDSMTPEEYALWTRTWFELWQRYSVHQIVTPGTVNLKMWLSQFDPRHIAPWIKDNATTGGRVSSFTVWEPMLFFGEKWRRERPSDMFRFTVFEQRFATGESMTDMHPCPKPLALWIDLIESYT
jgi:hypothetical protein